MKGKFRKIKALVAGLLAAVMVVGGMTFSPLHVSAEDNSLESLGQPTISIDVDSLIWDARIFDATFSGTYRVIFLANNVQFHTIENQLTGSLNLRSHLGPHFAIGENRLSVRVEVISGGTAGFERVSPTSTSVGWTPPALPANQLASPTGLNIDPNNVLRWTATDNRATSYRIYAGTRHIENVTTNFWQIDMSMFSENEGQTLQLTVVAEAAGLTRSDASAALPWTVGNASLPTPQISVNAAGLLTWTVHGAQNVRVYRNGTALTPILSNVTQVDLTEFNLPAGSQNIQIRFLAANGNNASNLSNTASVNLTGQLAVPTNVAISGGTLTWTAVPNATGYRVYVGGTARTTQNITGLSFNLTTLNLAAGEHNVQVRALGNGTTTQNSALSTAVTFVPGALDTPTALNITGATLSWAAVAGAVGYRIYIDGTARTTNQTITATNFNLASLNLPLGTYDVQVRALGNGSTTHNSGLSAVLRFEMQTMDLPVPTNVRLEGTVLQWNAVQGTRGYVVYVDGEVASASTMATHFALGSLVLESGSRIVQVRALGDGETTFDSVLSQPVVFVVAAQQPPQQLNPNDLPSGWAHPLILDAMGHGLVPNHLLSSFTQATTRAEFAALATALYETVMGYEIVGRRQFADTNDVNVQKMGYIGVVLGIDDHNFAPNNPLTREQAATMLARLAGAVNQPLPAVAAAFNDNSTIAPWAIVQVGQMQGAGIMQGMDAGNFVPQGTYTREMSIVTILRLFNIMN